MAKEDELRRKLESTRQGAIAVALCVARSLAESDPEIKERILVKAKKLHENFAKLSAKDGLMVISTFEMAFANPDKNPLFKTD